MTIERSCPCRWGVVAVTSTGTAPFPRKLKSAGLLLSFALVFGVMLFANTKTTFAQGQCQASGSLPMSTSAFTLTAGATKTITVRITNTSSTVPGGAPVAANLTGTTVVKLNCADAACSTSFATTPLVFVPTGANGCVSNDPGVTSCTAGANNTVNININSIPLAAGESLHLVATFQVQANVAPTCAGTIFEPGGTGPADLVTNSGLCSPQVAGGAQGGTAEQFPIVCPNPTECQESNVCNPQTNQCVITNKADSTACTDTVSGDCKVAGCEAGVCVQTHNNAADSTACTTTPDVAGDCGTPGCEAGVCVADHVPVPDSTACTDTVSGDCKVAGCEAGVCVQTHSNAADSTACTTTADIAGDCGTPGCEAGVCVADHVPVSDSTPCSVGVTGTPDECKTPGCESGVCVAAHNNKADSTTCTDTDDQSCTIAGCEAGSCVQAHVDNCGNQGCTPGFWKANADKKQANAWPVDPDTKLGTVFTIPPCLSGCSQNFANLTLRQALSLQGGDSLCEKAETLLRIATGSFLNASSSCVQFNLNAAALVAEVNGVLASCDASQFTTESTKLDGFNNQGCPINQQGQCSNP